MPSSSLSWVEITRVRDARRYVRGAMLNSKTTIESIGSENELIDIQIAALHEAANAILISTRGGAIVWVNRAFEELSGYSAQEAIGRDTRLLKSGRQPASFYQQLWKTILSGEKW